MKVIDIMQKVANKEIFRFRLDDVNYYVDKSNYICEEDGTKVEWYIDDEWLNMNAEVIEEDKKIEKLEFYNDNRLFNPTTEHFNQMTGWGGVLANKINEIIEILNEQDIQRH